MSKFQAISSHKGSMINWVLLLSFILILTSILFFLFFKVKISYIVRDVFEWNKYGNILSFLISLPVNVSDEKKITFIEYISPTLYGHSAQTVDVEGYTIQYPERNVIREIFAQDKDCIFVEFSHVEIEEETEGMPTVGSPRPSRRIVAKMVYQTITPSISSGKTFVRVYNCSVKPEFKDLENITKEIKFEDDILIPYLFSLTSEGIDVKLGKLTVAIVDPQKIGKEWVIEKPEESVEISQWRPRR